MAGKGLRNDLYFVSNGTLNTDSINQRRYLAHWYILIYYLVQGTGQEVT